MIQTNEYGVQCQQGETNERFFMLIARYIYVKKRRQRESRANSI